MAAAAAAGPDAAARHRWRGDKRGRRRCAAEAARRPDELTVFSRAASINVSTCVGAVHYSVSPVSADAPRAIYAS